MTVGLYDIDFWHSAIKNPNLELMKVFNYYYSQGDVIIFMTPQDKEDRFNKIIYFKTKNNISIPKTISVLGNKKSIYGYGFYKKFIPLESPYNEYSPSFLPYDLYEEKMCAKYDRIKKNSYVRIENNDMTYLNLDKKTIYIADEKTIYTSGAEEFIMKYFSKYNLQFVNSVFIKEESLFDKYYGKLENKFYLDFPITPSFFCSHLEENNVCYSLKPTEQEKVYSKFLIRIVKMILYGKTKQAKVPFDFQEKPNKLIPLSYLLPYLIKWCNSKKVCSLYEFFKDDKKAIKEINNLVIIEDELRVLLKQSPLTYNTQKFDF